VQESIVSTRQGNSAADPKPRASGPNHQNIGQACIAQDLIYFLIKGVDLNLVSPASYTTEYLFRNRYKRKPSRDPGVPTYMPSIVNE
jgi:hypothetical protein